MIDVLQDKVELDNLIMIEHKKNWIGDARRNLAAGTAWMRQQAGMSTNGDTATADQSVEDNDAIVNRSPKTTTTNNNYPPPPKSDGPWVALIVLLICGGLLAWWISQQPKPVQPVPPANSQVPGQVQIPGDIQWKAGPYNPYAPAPTPN